MYICQPLIVKFIPFVHTEIAKAKWNEEVVFADQLFISPKS